MIGQDSTTAGRLLPSGQMNRGRWWQAYLAAGLASTVVYFLLPGGSVSQAWVFMVVNLTLSVALAVGLVVHRPARPAIWRVLLVCQAPYVAANVFWYVLPLRNDVELSFPGPHDPLYLLSYVLEAAALAMLIRRRGGARNRADLIDASIFALGLGVVLWVFQIDRAFTGSELTLLGRGLTAAYPLFDLLLFGLVVRLAVAGGRRGASFWFLGLGVVCQLLSDVGYTEAVLRGSFRYGAPYFALYFLMYVFIGTAALHPTMRDLDLPVTDRRQTTLRRRIPFLAMAALVGPAVLLVQHERGADIDLPFIVVMTSVIFLLVLARVSDLMVDVADHERVQQQLSRLALIVESTDDAVAGWSTDGIYTSWNAGATRLYGYEAEEIVGQPITLMLPPHRVEEDEGMMRRVVAGEQVGHFDSERVCKDGSIIEVSITLSAIRDLSGTIIGGATIGRDITDAKRIEAELAVARDHALEASRMKSEFLATMSHEIRTPLNGVIGLTELLLTTPLDDRQRQYAGGVRGAGEALLGVISDILDFSKIEAGKMELERADFDVRGLVEEVAALMAEGAQRKGLELLAWCDPQLPAAVTGDAGRLRQVLLNLAGNAVKFTQQGEVVLRVRPISEDQDGVHLRFEVVDTGIGVSRADQDRLFDPFSQADASTTRRYGGTGLGLAICSRLVAAMGGRLGLDSEPGRGSRFWFELPLGLAEDAPVPVLPGAGLLDGVAVFVVDDNATNRLILESQLRSWGMRPDLSPDGPSALRRLREAASSGAPYRLALLDMCMADMNGLELAQRISDEPGLAATSLMLLTSTAGVEPEEARRAGIDIMLTKPVRQSQLHDALVTLVAPRDQSARAPAQAKAAADGARGHLLVVEDNATNQMVALGIVSHLGWTADVAANGLEAIEAVGQTHYEAVLMDCQMPEMDGYTATAEIRRREAGGSRLPVIAMTASAVEGDRDKCLAAGMDDYVTKPVAPEEVGAALARWTGKRGPIPRAPTTSADLPPTKPVVDQERLELLRQIGPADGSLFGRLVDAFLAETSHGLHTLGEAVSRQDGADVHQIAHRLKGAAGNLGATAIAELFRELEVAGGSGDMPAASELLRRAEAEFQPVGSALRAACEATPV